MKNPSIGIVIPVFNGLSYTSECLKLLTSLIEKLELDSKRFEIIVADDASTDGTFLWIKANYPQTTVLPGDGNLWWSGGINLGSKYAINQLHCEYVLWWNNDITPSTNYFSELLKLIDSEEEKILGSKIYYAHKPETIWSMGGIFNTKTGHKYMVGMDEIDSDLYQKPLIVDWLPGMGTLIHKSVFQKIGYVDQDNFPQYHGDSDFTFKARLSGFEIKVFPQLKIWNDKSNSGLLHMNRYKYLFKSLQDIKSNYHFGKDIYFYKRYAKSIWAYKTLAYKYCYYVGGFIKWKFMNALGFSKKKH